MLYFLCHKISTILGPPLQLLGDIDPLALHQTLQMPMQWIPTRARGIAVESQYVILS